MASNFQDDNNMISDDVPENRNLKRDSYRSDCYNAQNLSSNRGQGDLASTSDVAVRKSSSNFNLSLIYYSLRVKFNQVLEILEFQQLLIEVIIIIDNQLFSQHQQ